MKTIILISIIIAVIIWLGAILSFVWFMYRKRIKHSVYTNIPKYNSYYLKCYFIRPNNRITYEPLLINSDNQVSYEGGYYNVDQSCILFEKNTPIIHYYVGIPDPINYTVDKKGVEVSVDSTTYKTVMKTKIIRDLLAENKQLLIIMLLCGAIVVGIFILIGLQLGFFDDFINKGATQ